MRNGRTKNTLRNIVAGLLNRMVAIFLPFINRTVILHFLGAEFTGLTGLFTSILGMLNIAELGFNTAVVYSLYKPMADKDEQKICQTVSVLRQVYTYVGVFVLGIGLVIMPFLKHFIHGGYPAHINIYSIYFLYLTNSVISYFLFSYKESLLLADQRKDIAQNIRTAVDLIRYILQFICLLVYHNFYIYLIVTIFGTIATNISIEIATRRRYPYFSRVKGRVRIPHDIMTRVKGLFINRVCDILRNGLDSIIISSVIGLTATAIYGNYYYVYNALYGVLLVVINAMGASVGNSIVVKTAEENYRDLLKFSAISSWIIGVCTACLLCLYQPFMTMWVGRDLLLSNGNVVLFCVYFYVINMNNVRNQYISGTGIWWNLRKSYIIEALGNLILNILLGKWFGITGVLLATIITIFLFNYLMRNSVLFSSYFADQSYKGYLTEQLYFAGTAIVAAAASYFLCSLISGNGMMALLIRGGISFVTSGAILLAGIFLTKRWIDVQLFLKNMMLMFLER